MPNPNQRYSVGLVPTPGAAPPPPPATAAPAAVPAADAGERARIMGTLAMPSDEALDSMAYAAAEGLLGDGTMQAGMWHDAMCDLLTRAEAAEAERDRLAAEVAALRLRVDALTHPSEDRLSAAYDAGVQDGGERDGRFEAEIVAMQDAMESVAQSLDQMAQVCVDECLPRVGESLHDDAVRLRAAALATATAPQAAGTGGDDAPVWAYGIDVTGVYWVLMYRNYEPELRFLHRGLVDGCITPALIGPRLNPAPPGWREALAALDQDQEADHAAQ